MKITLTMNKDQLQALIANARWFDNYFVRSKQIGPDSWRVTTNYESAMEFVK